MIELVEAVEQIPTAEPSFATNKIGDVTGGNYSEHRADGTMRRVGNATSWKDMVGDMNGTNLDSNRDKVDYDRDNNCLVFNRNGETTDTKDRVMVNVQINHEFKVGTGISFYPHIHWFQENNTDDYIFQTRYRVQRNGQTKSDWSAWVEVHINNSANQVFSYTSGVFNQITRMGVITTDCSISDTIQLQLVRTDSIVANVSIYFNDLHGEIDSDGSDEEYVKV